MLRSLSELASESSSDKRRALLGQVSDMFYNGGRDAITEREMGLFADVVTRLLKDLDTASRAHFSAIVARSERTPAEVALALARDNAAVADPILRLSPALSDEHLVEIASGSTIEHRLSISKRRDLTERVSDTLIDFGELEVLESLADNATAAISAHGFDVMTARSADSASLREKVCLRGDLPVAAARKLLPYLNAEHGARLAALIAANSAQLGDIVRGALPELSAERSRRAKRRLLTKHLAAEVESGRKLPDDAVFEVLVDGHLLDLALLFSELSLLPEKQMANALLSTQPEPLALVCKALGLEANTYLKVDALRCLGVHLPANPPDPLREAYVLLDQGAA